MPYLTNVFINCPFDAEYRPLQKALVFEVLYLGLEPKLSRTISSGHIRIDQIKNLIANSRFGIHDLSRSRALKKGEYPRFNMPYELGLDIGCKEYGGRKFSGKRIIILETEKYHYQRVLSDIAGQDIQNHDNDPQTLIRKIRNWLSDNKYRKILPSPGAIWNAFNQFNSDLISNLSASYSKKDIEEMPIGDFIKFAKDWIKKFPH